MSVTTVCLSWIFHNQSVLVDLFSKLTVSKCLDNHLKFFCSNNSLPQASDFDCTHAPDISNVSDITDTSIGMNHLI